MNFSDKIEYKLVEQGYNEENKPIDIQQWVALGKCIIMPNTAAKQVKCADSEPRLYNYELIMRKPKNYLPKEGDWVHIMKKDGSVDEECVVLGRVTYKGRFLKLWV